MFSFDIFAIFHAELGTPVCDYLCTKCRLVWFNLRYRKIKCFYRFSLWLLCYWSLVAKLVSAKIAYFLRTVFAQNLRTEITDISRAQA